MPEWKPEVLQAFRALDIEVDATQVEAAKAYKVLAMRHHPDKNPGDPAATQRFQQVGAAWDVCQKHYENPARSYVQERGFYADDDDDMFMDPEEAMDFFRYMFEEMLWERYSRAGGRRYRQRGGQGGRGMYSHSGGYTESRQYQGGNYQADDYQVDNERNQAKKKAEYEQRLREFEMEIEAEQRELQKDAMRKSKDENRRASAYQQAFQAARAGNSSTVVSIVEEYGLDVNSPEKMPKNPSKKADKPANFETLLHSASRFCDESLMLFLLDKGADPNVINNAKLYPFHVAISYGNVAAAKFFLQRRVNGRSTPAFHPSKAAPDGRTPLQLAIFSGSADMVALMTKEATVHDVERCWQQDGVPQELKNILSTKDSYTLMLPGSKPSKN
ncbi:ankyrin repeat-containing domain protein [Mycena sp. CBHHK59/15]|nr:ankyrin repeat-containing domain protein [Mycena sp. CBHHK59/15]